MDEFFDELVTFASTLQIEAKFISQNMEPDKVRVVIQVIRGSCDKLETALNKLPPRLLTEEEYQDKVAAGKKIKLAEGGNH